MCVTKGYGKAVKGPLGTTGQDQGTSEGSGGAFKTTARR